MVIQLMGFYRNFVQIRLCAHCGYSRTLLHYTDQQRARQAGCDEVITKPYS